MEHLYTILNGAVFFWLLIGVTLKRRHPLHMMWMTAGFAMDFTLLLLIEIGRNATGQMFGSMSAWMAAHIFIAILLFPWYPMMLYSGGKVSAGKPKTFHRRIAVGFFVLRFLLWITAIFAMQAKAAGSTAGAASAAG